MFKYKIADLIENGCSLHKDGLLIGIAAATGDAGPCDGCSEKHGCNSLKNSLIRHRESPKSPYRESNAQMAKRLGITKRQASKKRKANGRAS